jgi:L-ascorbate metabolism protein UlaG (beta-lactamase superfamily)
MGKTIDGERRARIERSPQWKNGKFANPLEQTQGSRLSLLKEILFGNPNPRKPTETIPFQSRRRADFDHPPALRTTWLGHSTLIVEMEGQRVLIDPVWGQRVSPISFAGPERWYPPPLPLEELPDLNAILISHDHYDHLDYPTVIKLSQRKLQWIVPLGLGSLLQSWGVPAACVHELDWWESFDLSGIKVTATPARHFSGRGALDQNKTLWCGFAVTGSRHRVYYSGDTALFDEFIRIGERLGPFDLTMIEVGAYDRHWTDVHLGPEQALRVHQMVRGKILLPVHWGLFSLGFHGWTEPIERVLAAAAKLGVTVAVPRPGESIQPSQVPPVQRWWPDLPWRNGEEYPIRSSGVDHILR